MPQMALSNQSTNFEISYGIYTIERLPKGSKRTPKWDLHSTTSDRKTAESHAKTLAAQPYFDQVQLQLFKTCLETQERQVHKIKSYSRQSSKMWMIGIVIILAALALKILS
jgi:poly-beta-hydroxyalkanoate depolymerase